jgi:hypothetical protein
MQGLGNKAVIPNGQRERFFGCERSGCADGKRKPFSKIIDDLTADTINAYLASHRPTHYTITTLGRDKLVLPA